MKDLKNIIKDRRFLVFYDLEGTQASHEIIEIGAYKCKIDDDFNVRKIYKPFKAYVRPKHRIGHFVTKLTGISEKTIQDKAISFREMQNQFIKYLGKDKERCLFVSYGSQDGEMFIASAENNMDASMEFSRFVAKRTWDFCAFLKRYLQNPDGNPFSLERACEKFGIHFAGQAHDALADAYNLMDLYRRMLEDKETLGKAYQETLYNANKVPAPVREVLRRLSEGETVSPEDFSAIIQRSLK